MKIFDACRQCSEPARTEFHGQIKQVASPCPDLPGKPVGEKPCTFRVFTADGICRVSASTGRCCHDDL